MTIKVTPQLLAEIKALLRPPVPFDAVLKWNRNQPRGEKGTREGGRWVKGVSAGLGSQPGWGMQSTVPGMERTMGQAGYNDILNAPSGTGFRNRPRGVNIPEDVIPKTPPPVPSGSKLSVLKEATVESSDPLNSGSNASVVVEFDDELGTKALLKPEAGEQWEGMFTNEEITEVITNRDFSLAEREAIAYEIGHTLFGADNPVPETVLRESIDGIDIDDFTGGGDEGGGGYDEDYAREQYEAYKEKAQEQAMDDVGEEMYGLYNEAKQEHADDIEKRAEELKEIWNEEVENFPDNPAGTGSALREHPVLPLGSKGPFERREDQGALNPLEVLDEAGVDVDYPLNTTEKDKVRTIIRKALEDGYSELGDVDEKDAREHLDYDNWRENHEDTENRLYESKIQTFTSWRQSQGYQSSYGGGGGGGARNPDAPHPQGGSLQLWHEGMEDSGYHSMDEEDGARMAVLDYVLGTMDRHGGNLGFVDGRPRAIDNGYSMPAAEDVDDFKFRSVAVMDWKNEGHSMNIPEEIRNPILEQLRKTDWQALVARHPSMNAAEREAFLGRVERVTEALQEKDGLYQLWRRLRVGR